MVFNLNFSLFKTNLSCLTKFYFVRDGGGAFLLLAITLGLARAQDVCAPTDACGNLKIEIVRAPHDNTVSGPTCPNSTLCGGGNAFEQMYYKVYLRYSGSVTGNPNVFNLEYSRLNVVLQLKNLSSGQRLFSTINTDLTKSCFDPNTQWDTDKVLFKVVEPDKANPKKTVHIDFMNINDGSPSHSCGTGGDRVHMVRGTPNRADNCNNCYYLELYTVVVDAFPGEYIALEVASSQFQPYDNQVVCNPGAISVVSSGTHNGISTVQINTAASNSGTPNADILLESLGYVAGSNGTQDFEIQLKNTHATKSRTVRYAEFVVRVFSTEGITVTSGGNYVAQSTLVVGDNRYLHYKITFPGNGLVIAAQGTQSISLVKVKEPDPANQTWDAAVSFESTYDTRLSLTDDCTKLNVSGSSQTYHHTGDPFCSMAQEFTIRGTGGSTGQCGTTIQVGFKFFGTGGQLNISTFVFEIEFDLTGSLAISDVNYSDWLPSWDCPAPVSITCLDPNSTGTCFDIISDNVIRFCFSVIGNDAITITSDAFINIVFSNASGCIQGATIREVVLGLTGLTPCIPPINNLLGNGVSECPPQVRGLIQTEVNDKIEAVEVTTVVDVSTSSSCTESIDCVPSSCSATYSEFSDKNGNYGICVCEDCNCYEVTPEKNDNPLNGVTTFDLVLISKHILGIEALGSPYKMIAADANKSNSITTFDIVEIRKLILGIYQDFPANTSWRFVDASFIFPDPDNPFFAAFPKSIAGFDVTGPKLANFVGIKVGDVNNTAVSSSRPAERPVSTFSWPALSTAYQGDYLTVPVIYTGMEPLTAFQFGLQYDATALELISPSQGDLPYYDAGNFNFVKPGEIKTLWLPMDIEDPNLHIKPGAVLFYLTFKVLGTSTLASQSLVFDDAVLFNAAWKSDGTEFSVQHVPDAVQRSEKEALSTLQASIRPNPTSGETTLAIKADSKGKARLALFDAFGKRMFIRDLELTGAMQEFLLPETTPLPTGVYFWKVAGKDLSAKGHLVKQ